MTLYYQFTKKHFEYELKGILMRNKLGTMEDITEQWKIENDSETWEYIYKISTKNRSVDIIVFSSVDMNTNKVRDIGNDAVRVVMRWTTRNGNFYKKLGKHYRIKTLFKNLEKTVVDGSNSVFGLNGKEFNTSIA